MITSGRGGRGGRGRGHPSSNQSTARNPFAASQSTPQHQQQNNQPQSFNRQIQIQQHNKFHHQHERNSQRPIQNNFTQQQSNSSRNPFEPQQYQSNQGSSRNLQVSNGNYHQQQHSRWGQQNTNEQRSTMEQQQGFIRQHQQQGFVRQQHQQYEEGNREESNRQYQESRGHHAPPVRDHTQRNPFQQQGQQAISTSWDRNISVGQSSRYNNQEEQDVFTISSKFVPQSQPYSVGPSSTVSSGWNNASAHQQQSQSQSMKTIQQTSASMSHVDASVVVAGTLTADFRLDLPPRSSGAEVVDVILSGSSTYIYAEKESTMSDGPFACFSELPPAFSPYSDGAPFRAGFIPNVPPPDLKLSDVQSSSGDVVWRGQ